MAQAQKTDLAKNFELFLLEHGFISKPVQEKLHKLQAEKNLKQSGQGGRGASAELNYAQALSELVLAEKIMDEEDLAKAKAAFFNLPYVDLRQKKVPAEVSGVIPEESRSFYNIAPFEILGQTLKVAIIDPTNLRALEALEFLGQKQNFQIQLFLASATSVGTVIGKRRNLSSVVGQALQDIEQKQEIEKKPEVQKKAAVEQVIQDAPIIKIVDVILTNAIEANASDIHIEPSENEVRVRYRVDGILHTSLMLPKSVLPAIISRIKILSNLKIDESRLPQDGRFHFQVEKKSVDLRVSVLPLIEGEKVVMRILDKSGSVPTLEQLGVWGKQLDWIKENMKKTHGIFLITGPTGSGKSTTLYSVLSILNTTGVNIVTLEDPVEYFIPGVNQSQINPDIGLTFATGLRSILRQDPNVIMVGEIRDKETAELAVHAALTGHLVFSTLHTNNSIGAIPRLIDMEIEPFLLMASAILVMAQRLVRKICEHCKQEASLTKLAEEEIRADLKNIPQQYLEGIDVKNLKIYKGKGCEQCGESGYRGRTGIYEVLPLLPEVQEMLLAHAPTHKIYEATAKFGMITMKQDGVLKVLKGETTMEEIIRVTTE